MIVSPTINERIIVDRLRQIRNQSNRIKSLPEASNSAGDFTLLEQRIGIEFPADYKAFIENFQSVEMDSTSWVFDFRFQPEDFESNQKHILSLYSQRRSENDPICALKVIPDLPGMLVFGGDFEGSIAAWLIDKDYTYWPIVEYDGASNLLTIRKAFFLDWVLKTLKGR